MQRHAVFFLAHSGNLPGRVFFAVVFGIGNRFSAVGANRLAAQRVIVTARIFFLFTVGISSVCVFGIIDAKQPV